MSVFLSADTIVCVCVLCICCVCCVPVVYVHLLSCVMYVSVTCVLYVFRVCLLSVHMLCVCLSCLRLCMTCVLVVYDCLVCTCGGWLHPGCSPGQQGAPASSHCLLLTPILPAALPSWSPLAVPLARCHFESFLMLLGYIFNYCHRHEDLA